MADLDDDVGDMIDDLLTEAGRSATYIRGTTSTAITLRKSNQYSQREIDGRGGEFEVLRADFLAKTSDLPFDPPADGDRIQMSGKTWELAPTESERCFRRISDQMTRLFTRQISNP